MIWYEFRESLTQIQLQMKNVWTHSQEWRKINEKKFSHIIQLFSLLILSTYVYLITIYLCL